MNKEKVVLLTVLAVWFLYFELIFMFFITFLFGLHWIFSTTAAVLFSVVMFAVTMGNQNKDE